MLAAALRAGHGMYVCERVRARVLGWTQRVNLLRMHPRVAPSSIHGTEEVCAQSEALGDERGSNVFVERLTLRPLFV